MTQANDKSILMLPKLRDNRVKRGTTGKWNRQAPAAFDDVARSIDVVVAGDVANVNSIPSMWAHPLSLESILPSNDYNPRIRNPLVNQWRGMLAAIALAPDFETVGKFTAQAIDLSDVRYRTNNFIQSLVRLVPSDEKCLFDLPKKVNPWLKGYVFRWNKQSIGMTSPSTIVCPSEDADWTGLPWFIDNEVNSPEEYLTPDQRSRLSRWLVHLRKKITEQGMGISEAIAALINSFIDDLKGDREKDLNTDDNGNIVDLVKEELYFGIQLDLGIYTAINHPLRNPLKETLTNVFLPDLYFLRRPDAFPNADLPESVKSLSFGGSQISVILPIQSSFFNRTDAASLLSKLKVERLRAGTAIKLSMQVDGHPLEQEYELKNENAINGLPVAEIWPNFVHPRWEVYYAYSSLDIDDTRLSFEFPNVVNPTEDVHTFGSSKLSRFTSFPSSVICLCDEKTIGSIPLKLPVTIAESENEWTVGVDFGTSFTNAYKKYNDSDEKISFDGLHYPITDADPITRTLDLAENFIPLNQNMPISSLLTEKDGRNKVGSKVSKADIIFDARIYVAQDPTQVGERQNFLIGNLKWSSLNDKKPMRLFIEQLALQISAQAVKNGASSIQWALSYPTAFSSNDKKSYVKIWNDSSKRLATITGLRYEDLSVAATKHFRSESLAIAHFFNNKKEKPLSNTACVDIGGGTTDISIWELRNRVFTPVFQFSIQLAGRHLFSDVMKRSPRFLMHIRFTTEAYTDALVQLSKKNKGDLFYSALDAVVKGGSDTWLNEHREDLQNDERLRDYLQILVIGIAGIHYYIGLVLDVLHREDNKLYDSGKPVNVYFGGNGCRLLNWLSYTGEFGDDEVSNLLQEMVVRGSKFKPSGRTVYLSDLPKEEAACGLVVGKKKLGDPSINENALIAGEPCRIGERSFDWNDYIQFNEEVEENIDELQVEELVNLPQFLYWFHKSLRSKKNDINVPAIDGYKLGDPKKTDEENLANTFETNLDFWESVIEQLEDSMALEDGVTTETIRLEPPFILGLKALIEVLSKRWARKYEK